jgi:hypothetical protein
MNASKKMRVIKNLIVILILTAFLSLCAGFIMLLLGSFRNIDTLIYVSIGLIAFGAIIDGFFVIFGIYIYLKRRSEHGNTN